MVDRNATDETDLIGISRFNFSHVSVSTWNAIAFGFVIATMGLAPALMSAHIVHQGEDMSEERAIAYTQALNYAGPVLSEQPESARNSA